MESERTAASSGSYIPFYLQSPANDSGGRDALCTTKAMNLFPSGPAVPATPHGQDKYFLPGGLSINHEQMAAFPGFTPKIMNLFPCGPGVPATPHGLDKDFLPGGLSINHERMAAFPGSTPKRKMTPQRGAAGAEKYHPDLELTLALTLTEGPGLLDLSRHGQQPDPSKALKRHISATPRSLQDVERCGRALWRSLDGSSNFLPVASQTSALVEQPCGSGPATSSIARLSSLLGQPSMGTSNPAISSSLLAKDHSGSNQSTLLLVSNQRPGLTFTDVLPDTVAALPTEITKRLPRARHGPKPRNTNFRGVTYYKRTGRWEAHIWNNGKQVYLGASSTAEKAARAYDRAAIHFRRVNADLNFELKDYKGELKLLRIISEEQLLVMLRKQSAGGGKAFPEYPREVQTAIYYSSSRELGIKSWDVSFSPGKHSYKFPCSCIF